MPRTPRSCSIAGSARAKTASESVAERLSAAAAMYEMAELNAAHAAAFFAGDADAAARIDAPPRPRSPTVPDRRARVRGGAQFEYNLMWPSELVRQGTEIGEPWAKSGRGSSAARLPYALARSLAALGSGPIERGERLSGGPVGRAGVGGSGQWPAASSAPTSLAAAAERIPSAGAGDARIRVEKYTMPDGSRQFAVYVAGSKAIPASEASSISRPGRASSSSAALGVVRRDARRAARTRAPSRAMWCTPSGTPRAAMVTGHLALEGGYDVQTLVSLGSPIEADVGPEHAQRRRCATPTIRSR